MERDHSHILIALNSFSKCTHTLFTYSLWHSADYYWQSIGAKMCQVCVCVCCCWCTCNSGQLVITDLLSLQTTKCIVELVHQELHQSVALLLTAALHRNESYCSFLCTFCPSSLLQPQQRVLLVERGKGKGPILNNNGTAAASTTCATRAGNNGRHINLNNNSNSSNTQV